MMDMIAECAANVAPRTIVEIIRVESEGNPLAVNVNGARLARAPRDKAEAVRTARAYINRGYTVDLGLMQVNSSNLRALGATVEDMFDSCKNIRAGARVLTDFYVKARPRHSSDQAALQAALSAYNTGSYSRGFRNGYVRKYLQPSRPQAARVRSVKMAFAPQDTTPVAYVANIVQRAFDARITDTVRAQNVNYGAANSYHKRGQAIDFVPRAGLTSINRDQIRAVMAQSGVQLVELFGPGDPGHSNHWHIAFSLTGQGPSASPPILARADQGRAPDPFQSSTVIYIRGQERKTMPKETFDPVISTNEADASAPGVQVEHTAERAEENGAFEETAMSEADAWDSNADIHSTAIVVGGVRVAAAKE